MEKILETRDRSAEFDYLEWKSGYKPLGQNEGRVGYILLL